MSKVVIAGDASGTGTFTISAPNGNTDRTLVLPDEAGTVALQGGAGVGKVLQVVAVNGRNADWSTSSATLAAMSDTSISITPTSASSKIYVTWQLAPHSNAGTSVTDSQIVGYRDTIKIGVVYATRNFASSGNGYIDKTVHGSLFDHPNTTSPVTYSLYASTNGGTFYAHRTWNLAAEGGPIMRIIAMEIEASTWL